MNTVRNYGVLALLFLGVGSVYAYGVLLGNVAQVGLGEEQSDPGIFLQHFSAPNCI